jgi:hypothetical protein
VIQPVAGNAEQIRENFRLERLYYELSSALDGWSLPLGLFFSFNLSLRLIACNINSRLESASRSGFDAETSKESIS